MNWNLIRKTYNLEILHLCSKDYGISDISSELGLTYKSVFLRVKELEKAGLIEIKSPSRVGEKSKIKLAPKHSKQILREVNSFLGYEEELKRSLKNNRNKKIVKDILVFLDKNRFAGKFSYGTELDHLTLILINTGMIKERLEITKKGKRYLTKNIK